MLFSGCKNPFICPLYPLLNFWCALTKQRPCKIEYTKLHERFHNVPKTECLSSFIDHLLQSIAQKVKSFIKDTNQF